LKPFADVLFAPLFRPHEFAHGEDFGATPSSAPKPRHPHKASQFNAGALSQHMEKKPGLLGQLANFAVNMLTFEMRMIASLTHTMTAHSQHHACTSRPVLQGAPITPQSPADPHWHFDLLTRTSCMRWRDDAGTEWHSVMNFHTKQHTSMSAWSKPDESGTYHREHLIHNTDVRWYEQYNPEKGVHQSSTAFSEERSDGFQLRRTYDYQTGLGWQEAIIRKTGAHLSMSDWTLPDHQGIRTRRLENKKTGEVVTERMGRDGVRHISTSTSSAASTPQFSPPVWAEVVKQLAILGLTPGASSDDIKHAHHRLALASHPDRIKRRDGESTPAFEVRKAREESKFLRMQAAYDYLNIDYLRILIAQEQGNSAETGGARRRA